MTLSLPALLHTWPIIDFVFFRLKLLLIFNFLKWQSLLKQVCHRQPNNKLKISFNFVIDLELLRCQHPSHHGKQCIQMTTCQCYSYSSRGFIFTSSEVLIYHTCHGDREKNDMHRGGGLCTVQTTCNAGAGNKRESTV